MDYGKNTLQLYTLLLLDEKLNYGIVFIMRHRKRPTELCRTSRFFELAEGGENRINRYFMENFL